MDESILVIALAMLALVFVAVMFIALFVVMGRRRNRRREAWRKVAERLGGELIEGKDQDRDELRLEVDGARVFVHLHFVRRAKSSKTYQRAVVLAPEGWGLMAQVYRETPLLTALGKALGGQDVELGDRAFDEAFVVKSSDPEWLRRALTAGTRRAHLALPRMSMELMPRLSTVNPASNGRVGQMIESLLQQARQVLGDAGDDPMVLGRARMMVGDGVLTIERSGASLDEAELLVQVELAAAYARDFFAGDDSQLPALQLQPAR